MKASFFVFSKMHLCIVSPQIFLMQKHSIFWCTN